MSKPLPAGKACLAMLDASAVAPKPAPGAKTKAKPLGSGQFGAPGAPSVGLLLGSLFSTRG